MNINSYKNKNDIVNFILSDKYLKLTILPTEKCNFRCTYCYEDFTVGRMSDEIVTGIKNLIAARAPTLSNLTLSWFGGEPLLASDIVLDISNFAQSLTKQYENLTVRADITTNGYTLDLEMINKLYEVGVNSYQISIDGPPDFHNKTRVMANGNGTYDRIYSNLYALKQSDLSLSVLIRVHLTPENTENIEKLKQFILKLSNDFNDNRFSFFFKPIEHLGGNNDSAFDILGSERNSVIDALNEIVARESKQSLVRDNGMGYICYAARANAFVIRANGSLGKCTIALDHYKNMIGRILPDGRVSIDSNKVAPWLRGLPDLDFSTMACPAAGYLGAPSTDETA